MSAVKAKEVGKAIIEIFEGNFVEKTEREKRFDICKKCPSDRLGKFFICKECGCEMAIKTWLKNFNCNLKHW